MLSVNQMEADEFGGECLDVYYEGCFIEVSPCGNKTPFIRSSMIDGVIEVELPDPIYRACTLQTGVVDGAEVKGTILGEFIAKLLA